MICGSSFLDFKSLEDVAKYADGYHRRSRIIRDFWDIVHNKMDVEQQRSLLAFVTGSDRVPIEGLSGIEFIIGRNGPDSELLPTSHTCFNHLLLPEYVSTEKLERMLKIAISQSEGFGLI